MTKDCYKKVMNAGFKFIRTDRQTNTIKVKTQHHAWAKLEGPFPSFAAAERRAAELLQDPFTLSDMHP